MRYKNEVYDKSYVKLKVSDNIDRYRLDIVTKLEEFQSNETIVKAISKNYIAVTKTEEEAVNKAIRNIDEVIDAFNAIEDFIAEIDNKNRNYINSTIGKIKFLLSEEDNIIGKLNTILKFVKDQNKKGKQDRAMRILDGLYNLPQLKVYNMENSLYAPRGAYQRNANQVLDDVGFDFDLNPEFLSQFRTAYNEIEVANFLDANLVDGVFQASKVLSYDCTRTEFMMVVYSIILAVEKSYVVEIIDDSRVETEKFIIKDFIIRKTLV